MKKATLPLLSVYAALFLSACGPLLVPYEDSPSAGVLTKDDSGESASRKPLDVPPELRGEVAVPRPSEIATKDAMPTNASGMLAGKQVGLDARVYEAGADQVFSAVVDTMVGLNYPVQSVDSASGTVTTDWIRKDADNVNLASGLFGDTGPAAYRYRFVVRVLRLKENAAATRLDVHTLGQVYMNKHWINKPLKRAVSEEVFSAVEERLAKQIPQSQVSGGSAGRP